MQPMNGKMMMFDFPFKRPICYQLHLAEGCTIDVSKTKYYSTAIGDTITAECMELSDVLIILSIIVVLICLFFALFVLI